MLLSTIDSVSAHYTRHIGYVVWIQLYLVVLDHELAVKKVTKKL